MYVTAFVVGLITGYIISRLVKKFKDWDGNIIIGSKIDIGDE